MTKQEKVKIAKFIDGEKRNFQDIKKIYKKLKQINSACPYNTFLDELFSDELNYEKYTSAKRAIVNEFAIETKNARKRKT